MKSMVYTLLATAILVTMSAQQSPAGESAVLFADPFDDDSFLAEDFVARSGFKTPADRGLVFEAGKFGGCVRMTKPYRIDPLDDMTGTDLDLATGISYTTRHRREAWDVHNQPVFWGAGRCTVTCGALAFWVKGALTGDHLFEQAAMAWGRKERRLLGITGSPDGIISAYIRDVRYVDHEISGSVQWDADTWNHVALSWDRARGMALFVNGKEIASSMGKDSWWETQIPGLFHFPLDLGAYDEFYYFDRPLNAADIDGLMTANRFPESRPAEPRTDDERNRLAAAHGLSFSMNLPLAGPLGGDRVLAFEEVTPSYAGDGHVPGTFCFDGRYQLAWPHPIAVFTIVPGDVDFQAEKLDIDPPADRPFNYVTIEGNLTGMPSALLDARKENDTFTGRSLFHIPENGSLFYGVMLDRTPHPRITLPFLKGYGAPGEFEGDVRLPLTGDTRVHEVGLFDVTVREASPVAGETTMYLAPDGFMPFQYEFVRGTMFEAGESTVFGTSPQPPQEESAVPTDAFRRLHIATQPATVQTAVGGILLDLALKTAGYEDMLAVRVHDPGTPHRIWTHAEMKLRGFENGGRLRIILESPPMVLAAGDIVWLDIMTFNSADIFLGGDVGSTMTIRPPTGGDFLDAYEQKALLPTIAQYTKAYHHKPWVFEKMNPDIEHPHTFGGQFDSITPAMAVLRVMPESFRARYYVEWGSDKYYWGGFDKPEVNFPIKDIAVPDGIPRWAYLQRTMQQFRWQIVDFIAANQNSDGQLWGGWNDDTLIMRNRPDICMEENPLARDVVFRVYEGLDRTNIFGEGFCRIKPIDNLHNGDFVRERFRLLLFKQGDPFIYRRALETAVHWNKPDTIPYNWGNGSQFLFDRNILEWYWGMRKPRGPFTTRPWDSLNERLSRSVSYLDDIMLYRCTESRVHTDNSRFQDEDLVTQMVLGGRADETISVSWPKGSDADLSRWVTYADSTRLACRIYLFDDTPREVTVQLYRLEYGDYRVMLSRDRDGSPGEKLSETTVKRLRRFDTVTVTIPPREPVVLTIGQTKHRDNPGPRPDLAVASYDKNREENLLSVRVSNLGAAMSKKTTMRILDASGKKLAEKDVPAIEAPTDFVQKSTWVNIENMPRTGDLTVIVDPKDRQDEILETNNTAIVK